MKYRVAEKPCEICGDTLIVKQFNRCRKCCYGYKKHQYSPMQADALMLKRYGKTAAQIAKSIDCSVNRLLDRLDRMPVHKAILPPDKFVPWEKNAIVKAFESRGGIEKVAKKLGITAKHLYIRVRDGESIQSASTRKRSQPTAMHSCKNLGHALGIILQIQEQTNDNNKQELQTVVDILRKITRRKKKAA